MEYNIKIYIQEMRWEHVYCVYWAKDREQWQELVNPVMKTGSQLFDYKCNRYLSKDSTW